MSKNKVEEIRKKILRQEGYLLEYIDKLKQEKYDLTEITGMLAGEEITKQQGDVVADLEEENRKYRIMCEDIEDAYDQMNNNQELVECIMSIVREVSRN